MEDGQAKVAVGIDTMRWMLRAGLIRCGECWQPLYVGGVTELTELVELVDAHKPQCQSERPAE